MSDDPLTADRKRRIAGRARTLQERLAHPAEDGPAVEDPDEWLSEWRDRVADGDGEAFGRRLDHLGITEGEAGAAVSTHGWPDGEPLPGWIEELERLVADVVAADRGSVPADAPADVPFVDILSPAVDHARDRIDRSVAPDEVPAVVDAMAPWLYERLASLSAHSLFVEFKTYVAHHDRDLAMADDPDPPADDCRHYRGFVDAMLGDGFVRFVEEYALLARLLVTTIRQWVGVVEEFAARLAADRSALRECLGADDLGAVADVEAAGDRHDDGRAVLAVTFESGVRAAYKPRSLDVEVAFYDLLDWLADRTDLPTVDRPRVLVREEYGWLEWIEPDPCTDRAAVERYYRRGGVLLGVLYALRFTDGHLENLIAAGEHPVVVDLETLAHPEFPDGRLPRDDAPPLRESVLRTGLLPVHDPDSDRADLSGFGADELPAEGERREFTAVNTDLMDLEYVEGDAETFENLPRVDGETVDADECFESLRGGLRAAHDALRANREALLSGEGPLSAFEDAEVRVIYRSTRTYGTILSSLTAPEYLRTGLKFGCKLEALARPQATGSVDAPWSVHDNEVAALERLDVPRFTMSTTGTTLRGPADPVDGFAALSPRESVGQRLRGFDATDCREQCWYVDLAFGDPGGADHADGAGTRPIGDPAALSDADAARVARELFARVSDAAVDDGAPAWSIPTPRRDGGVELRWADEGLYRGRLGVAVFAAAVATTAEGPVADDAATLAADAAEGVRDSLATGDGPGAAGIAAGSGLVYGFTLLDDLLDGDYLADARRAAAPLTADRAAGDDRYGVMDGSAGALLALLALHERTGDGETLDRAVTCGEHLLADRSGGRWPLGVDGRPLTGFAHGAAGVGYALARLAGATGEDRFREAALDAVAFEDDHYDPATGEWADLRAHGSGEMDGWCNGRTGIGLARLGTLAAVPADPVRQDVERALSGVPDDRIPRYDHACCGAVSWIALFLAAGRRLDEPRHERRARRIAAGIVPGDDGEWALQSGTPRRPDPTLFRGLGGVGYSLLRIANPDLPSVLLFE